MKIVMILTNSFEPDVRVYKEAKYLAEQEKEITILCWDRKYDTVLPEKEETDGINIVRFRIPSKAGSGYRQIGAYLKYVKCCKKYLKEHKTDYIHCHDLDGYIAYRLLHRKRIPYVFDMHEYYIQGGGLKRKAVYQIVKKAIGRSHCSLYENDGYLKLFAKKVTAKLIPLKNYPDSYLEKLPKTASEKLRIGYHGCVRNQIPEFTALFEACKDLNNVQIDINGGGIDLPALKELEKKYINVYVHGAYNGLKESSGLYQKTDVLFCGYNPNNANYQGDAEVVKFYEAIVTGTPMIMAAGTGMADKIKKNGWGMVADTRSVEQIREVVKAILENPKSLEECRENMEKAASDYQWRNAVKVLKRVYQE